MKLWLFYENLCNNSDGKIWAREFELAVSVEPVRCTMWGFLKPWKMCIKQFVTGDALPLLNCCQ